VIAVPFDSNDNDHDDTSAPEAPAPRRHQVSASAILGDFYIEAPGYGRARWIVKWERHGPHMLPVVLFSGGYIAALYQVPAGQGRWRRVYRDAAS